MRRAMGQLQMVEGVAEAAELISAQFGLLTPPRSAAAVGSQPADGEVAGLCEIWGGYIANNVCPTTCASDCSNWGGGDGPICNSPTQTFVITTTL